MKERYHHWDSSLKPLVLGYVLSIVWIAAIYRFATRHHLEGIQLTLTILGFGLLMALTQLVFFLHLGVESKPHWKTITFAFMVLIIIIVVGGTLWIMSNLNYNIMPPMSPQMQM